MKKKELVSMSMPTAYGNLRIFVWEGQRGQEPVAVCTQNLDPKKEVMVRIHSECLTGDVFYAETCDCGAQKDLALKKIMAHGNGILIYHRQEGRNMGLFKKIQAYNLMQEGMDTHEANLKLVGSPDAREYSEILSILQTLLIGHKSSIRLLTNNPHKILFLERSGYRVLAEALRTGASVHNSAYTEAKNKKFLHNSVGYGPYVGATLFRRDIAQKGSEIAATIAKVPVFRASRKIFLGVATTEGDLADARFAEELTMFYQRFRDAKDIFLVLHMNYPKYRQEQRTLSRFLEDLHFPYSLHFRLGPTAPETKIDIELLDSFHAEHVIFQLKSEHLFLIEQERFAEYFSSANKFLILDESWGKGIAQDAFSRRDAVLGLVSHGLSRIGVAGGFSAENASEIYDLEDYFKIPVSVDAESKLRTDGTLDLSKLSKYLGYFFPHGV